MTELEFNYQFGNPPKPDYEVGGGEKLVDTSGYVSAEEQILNMLNAGMRLDESRKEMYDTDEDFGDDSDFDSVGFDPTRLPGVDPADVSQLDRSLGHKLRKQLDDSKVIEDKPLDEKKEE
jgi:hypothetical protein